MQWILDRLKGRLGIAVVIAVVVLTVVGIGRALGGRGSDPGLSSVGSGSGTTPVSTPSDSDDGVDAGPTVSPSGPSMSPGAAQPMQVAQKFLTAWLRSELSAEAWHTGVSRYATRDLADELSGVDPSGVPAERTTGESKLIERGAGAVAVTTPVDSGTVELSLVVVDGVWLVGGVDWSRA